MSSFNYIVWIINRSREQDPGADKTLKEFKMAVLNLMKRVNTLMTVEEPLKVKVIRGKTLNHYPHVIDHLLSIFTPAEVGVIAAGFLDVVPVSDMAGRTEGGPPDQKKGGPPIRRKRRAVGKGRRS